MFLQRKTETSLRDLMEANEFISLSCVDLASARPDPLSVIVVEGVSLKESSKLCSPGGWLVVMWGAPVLSCAADDFEPSSR